MEELNKNQIVLLTLLVSFVTSIATGIVTVTLMDQAPSGVTQTVNRVVERTIEKVVPGEIIKERTIVKEVPVIVTGEELIVKVINDASPAVVRISTREGATLGSGFLASDDGLVISTARLFGQASEGQVFQVALRNGDKVTARLTKFSPESDIVALRLDSAELTQLKNKLLAAVAATSTPSSSKLTWTFLDLEDVESTGQTVISLGSPDEGPLNVSVGIVSSLMPVSDSPEIIINTNAANIYNTGGPILNTRGKVIGMSQESGSAVSTASIRDLINSLAS